MSRKHFLHFGCWNKGRSYFRTGETDQASNLTNVMRKLNEVSDSIKPEFIVVAGDNYYPDKINIKDDNDNTKKIKILDEDNLKSGFDSLPKTVEVDVIMGNHDYETNLYTNLEQNNIETECKILKIEYEFEKKKTNNIDVVIHKSRKFNDDTLILMIDTTIYDDNYVQDIVNCYKVHPEFKHLNTNTDLTIDYVRNYQSDFIKNNIRQHISNLKNLIIIGHHPITGFKLIKNRSSLIDSPGLPFIKMLYDDIFEISKENNINYYYLCADLHRYQVGNISIYPDGEQSSSNKMLIKQYIVGTGGADLDQNPFTEYDLKLDEKKSSLQFPLKPDNQVNDDNKIYNIEYLMTNEELNIPGTRYGFLQCDNDGTNLIFKFIDVDHNSDIEQSPTTGLNLLTKSSILGGKRIYHNKKNKKTYKKMKMNSKKYKSRTSRTRRTKRIIKTKKYKNHRNKIKINKHKTKKIYFRK